MHPTPILVDAGKLALGPWCILHVDTLAQAGPGLVP